MNRPEPDYSATLPAVIRRAASCFGDRDFVVSDSARLTFAQVEAASRLMAKQLLASGVGKGTPVGIQLPSGPDFVVAWAAIGRIGALIVPFSTLYRPEELRNAMRIADVHLLVSSATMFGRDQHDFLERTVPGLSDSIGERLYLPELPYLRSISLLGKVERDWASPISLTRDDSPTDVTEELLVEIESEVSPADRLLVIFTSGSAAEPKAVVHTHGAAIGKTSLSIGIGGLPAPGSRVFVGAPFFWVGGILAIAGGLQSGATIVTQERFEPKGALDLIETERTSVVLAWPSLTSRMRSHHSFEGRDLSATPQLSGEPFDMSRWHGSFGMTETMGFYSAGPRPDNSPSSRAPLPPHLRGSCGAVLAGYELKIIDPSNGSNVPDGTEGELVVRGDYLMDGLYKKERADVFDEDGWYHTGDRGCLREGYLFFAGRSVEMIKSQGANVSAREVEVVLESLTEIEEAYVFGLIDRDGNEVVAAAVVGTGETSIDIERIRHAANERLSSYKVPRLVVSLTADEIPYLATGKVDKKRIRELTEARENSTR